MLCRNRLVLLCLALSASACSVVFSDSEDDGDGDAGLVSRQVDGGSKFLDAGEAIACTPFLDISDTFDSGGINSNRWLSQTDAAGAVSISDDRLRLQYSPDGSSSVKILSRDHQLSMRDKRVSIEVVEVPSFPSARDSNVRFQIGYCEEGTDCHYYALRTVDGGSANELKLEWLYSHDLQDGTEDFYNDRVTYSPTLHRFWQIRESGGVLHYETAPTPGEWKTLFKVNLSSNELVDLESTALEIRGHSREDQDQPGFALLDNLNIDPNCSD